MSSINFDNPWLLLLALPVLLLLLVPFFLTVRKDNRNVHNVGSCILHVIIAVCMGFSAAGTTIKSIVTETNVYVVADLSYSARKSLDTIDRYIQDLEEDLPQRTELGVVCFGATDSHVVHTRLGEPLTSVKGSADKIDDTSTDIVSALDYTSKIFKSGVVKRIVLITDAKQSNDEDGGALKRQIEALHASKVYVDAIYIDSNLKEDAIEAQISDVDVSERVYQGQDVSANIYLQSTVNTRATLSVYRNDETEPFRKLTPTLSVGTSSVVLPLSTSKTGDFSYTVRLSDVAGDENPYNNEYKFAQVVAEEPSVLFISSERADESYAEQIFGVDLDEDFYYVDPENVELNRNVPSTVAELCKYDEIVLSNVNVENMPNHQLFIESLDTVVSVLGKSLVGLGDLHLENAAGTMKKLADMFPVEYGNPVKEQKLYVIVVDTSHSMRFYDKLSVAKKAAKDFVDVLEDNDKVAVVGFSGDAQLIQPITSGYDRLAVQKAIDEMDTDHGTVISGGLNAAITALGSYAKEMLTQVFLITDGVNAAEWVDAYEAATTLYEEYEAVTSVLGIDSEANAAQLKRLANSGQGKYAAVEDGSGLKDIFNELVDEGGVDGERNAVPKKQQLFDEVLNGLEDVELPYVHGYVVSKGKTSATTVLTIEHPRKNDASITVPLYSYWQCGEGKVSSFLSAFSAIRRKDVESSSSNPKRYLENWFDEVVDKEMGTTLHRQFFTNIFTTSTPVEQVDQPFKATVRRQTGGASLEVRPAELKPGATVEVTLISPDGERSSVQNLIFDSNVYVCSFAMPSVGTYQAEITYTYQGNSETLVKTMQVSYLPEYDSFAAFDASPLYKMLSGKGTVSEDGKLAIVNDENEVGVRIIDLTVPLLVACVALFTIDIIVRKVKWADIKGLFRKIKKGDKQ